MLKKGQKFTWNDDVQVTFEVASRRLTSTKTLAFYRPDRKTRLITDASRLNGVGFVLEQEIDGIWKPVQAGYFSLSLSTILIYFLSFCLFLLIFMSPISVPISLFLYLSFSLSLSLLYISLSTIAIFFCLYFLFLPILIYVTYLCANPSHI